MVSRRAKSISVLAGVAALLVAPGVCDAMGIHYERRLLARSTDGGSALYEVRGRGPEGGGSLTYRIEGKRSRKALEFLVSSDFSPGGSARPQQISIAACEERLDALGAEVAKRGIRGVAVSPARCRNPDRDGLVTVATPP